jgi:hypothetical protein
MIFTTKKISPYNNKEKDKRIDQHHTMFSRTIKSEVITKQQTKIYNRHLFFTINKDKIIVKIEGKANITAIAGIKYTIYPKGIYINEIS